METIDRQFWERELSEFVPDQVFDAHCHLWPAEQKIPTPPGEPEAAAGRDAYRQAMQALHPNSKLASLFIPFPTFREQMGLANEWVARNSRLSALDRGELFVTPQDDPARVRQQVREFRSAGLKCYHKMALRDPTWEAEIPEYLPERLVQVAHEEKLVITLHMVKSRSLGDPSNIRWIRHYCTTYPNMRLILAHSGRGFQPAHNFEGLPHLTGLPNLYFDSSANCEPMAHLAILKIIGHEHFMYGSDYPVSHFRGRSLGAADSFVWLYEDTPVWGEKHTRIDPVLVGLEHLRSLKWACWAAGLSKAQVQDVFWNNAAELLGVG